jgi:sodium-dependent phosphate cotransporter
MLSLSQIYPFTLGVNIGTCLTALWVAVGLSTDLMPAALQLGLVHLFYNIAGVLCFYGVPGLRSLPPWAAQRLAALARDRKILAVGYVGVLFFGLPSLLVFSGIK